MKTNNNEKINNGNEQIEQPHLLDLLKSHFNIEELEELCFALRIDFEELSGRRKSAKAREIILLTYRQNRLPDLLLNLHRFRPDVKWPDVSSIEKQITTLEIEKIATWEGRLAHQLSNFLEFLPNYLKSLRQLLHPSIKILTTLGYAVGSIVLA